MIKWLKYKYWAWVYRHQDETICCCGETMGNPGCSFHCCRSMKEYAITSAAEK